MKLAIEQPGKTTTDRLASLITLQKRILAAADQREAEFVLVNDTGFVFPQRQALLFLDGQLRAHSGGQAVDQSSPYLDWTRKVVPALTKDLATDQPTRLSQTDCRSKAPKLTDQWRESWPEHALWVPIRSTTPPSGLLLTRDRPWNDAELRLLQHWLDTAAPILRGFRTQRLTLPRKPLLAFAVVTALVLTMFIPVRLSTLAQAEIAPRDRAVIRAPINGIVDSLAVRPNQSIEPGQLLFALDDTELQGELEQARQRLSVAQAELQRARQRTFNDPRASAELPVLEARTEEASSRVRFLQSELEKVRVLAPRGGIAIISAPDEWTGRPVQLGERLLEVAPAEGDEIELWVPVADAIVLQPGAAVNLFLNVDPSRSLQATLLEANYKAEQAPTGELAYRARARLESDATARIGWRGVAKINGEQVSLAYYLFRRPLTELRSWLGW